MTPAFEDELLRVMNRRLWMALFAVSSIATALVGVVAALCLQPKSPPYVFVVNEHGQPIGAIAPVIGTATIPDIAKRWTIGEYVENVFSVKQDLDEQKYAMHRAYFMSTGQAGKALTDYWKAHNPMELGAHEWQSVAVTRVLSLPTPDSYQVDYVVTRHAHSDQDVTTTNWRATLRVATDKPTAANGLGLYVNYLDFGKEEP